MHTVGRSVAAIGFNVETIEYRNAEICIWDVGGESGGSRPTRLDSNPRVERKGTVAVHVMAAFNKAAVACTATYLTSLHSSS